MMEDPTAADFGSVDASEPRRWRYRLPISISLIGIFIVLGFHLALRMQIRPPRLWIYWIGLVLVAVPGVLAGERKAATFSLGAFAFLQCFAYSLSSPFGLVYLRDPLYNMQLATLVQTTQTWHPAMGAGQAFAYSFYPGSNLFHVAVAFATGLPLETLYLFVTGILRFAVLPLGLARMLGRFVKPQATYIAVAIFLATPSNLFDLPHQQEFAYVFLILGLYAALLSTTAQRGFRFAAATQVAAFILVATIAVSHAFTAYITLFVFPALAVVGLSVRSRHIPYRDQASRVVLIRTFKGLPVTALAFTGTFLLWSVLVSSPLELAWLDYASESLERLFLPRQFLAPTGSAPSGVSAGFSYTRDELAVIGAALLILLITGVLGHSPHRSERPRLWRRARAGCVRRLRGVRHRPGALAGVPSVQRERAEWRPELRLRASPRRHRRHTRLHDAHGLLHGVPNDSSGGVQGRQVRAELDVRGRLRGRDRDDLSVERSCVMPQRRGGGLGGLRFTTSAPEGVMHIWGGRFPGVEHRGARSEPDSGPSLPGVC